MCVQCGDPNGMHIAQDDLPSAASVQHAPSTMRQRFSFQRGRDGFRSLRSLASVSRMATTSVHLKREPRDPSERFAVSTDLLFAGLAEDQKYLLQLTSC